MKRDHHTAGLFRRRDAKSTSGFTLIEMLITIAIILIFTVGMFSRQQSFESTVQLQSLTRNIALVYRSVQTRGGSGASYNDNTPPYGVSVTLTNPRRLILYREEPPGADGDTSDPDGYDSESEKLSAKILPEGFQITAVCAVQEGNSARTCNDDDAAYYDQNDRVDIYYRRPRLSAQFLVNGVSPNIPLKRILVEITHVQSGKKQHVIIDKTGLITNT